MNTLITVCDHMHDYAMTTAANSFVAYFLGTSRKPRKHTPGALDTDIFIYTPSFFLGLSIQTFFPISQSPMIYALHITFLKTLKKRNKYIFFDTRNGSLMSRTPNPEIQNALVSKLSVVLS